nr:MAG TPA: hypothetical protein [Crassvirales sp.]
MCYVKILRLIGDSNSYLKFRKLLFYAVKLINHKREHISILPKPI